MSSVLAALALIVSIMSLGISVYFWMRSFRPIVTAMVKTHTAGNERIAYDLVLLNSGTIPAKDIQLLADEGSLSQAMGTDSGEANRKTWLACFSGQKAIAVLHNGEHMSCSFGTTRANGEGFWKYNARVSITIQYRGWFGRQYEQSQEIEIRDSDSFTDFSWEATKSKV